MIRMKLNALIVDVNTEKKLFVNHFVECIAMPNTEQSKKKVRKEKRIIYIYIYISHGHVFTVQHVAERYSRTTCYFY